eukprot:5446930-Amphidinium_carterae.1
MPPLGLSLATLYGLQGFDNTFAITDNSSGFALFQGTHNGQEFSSKDRLPAARRGRQARSPVSVPPIGPDSVHASLHDGRAHEGARTPGLRAHVSANQTHAALCSSEDSGELCAQ